MTMPISVVNDYTVVRVANDVFLVSHCNAHILQTNTWAAAALEILQSGLDIDTLIDIMHEQSGLEKSQIRHDLEQLLSTLTHNPPSETIPPLTAQAEQPPERQSYQWCLYCELNNRVFQILFDNESTFESNRLLLAPLCLEKTPDNVTTLIHCSETAQSCGIWVNNEATVATEDTDWLHGLLRRTIIKQAYGEKNTTVTLHAAAIRFNDKTLLFIGPSGAGKSSLTRHFCSKGFDYLGDDSIPVDLTKNLAYPMPTGVSLKPGSWSLDQDIDTGHLERITLQLAGKTFRTWQPKAGRVCRTAQPIDAIVFSQYIEGCELDWQPVALKRAVEKLDHSQTRFNPNTDAETSIQCLHWLHKVPCFSLHYGDLNDAYNSITEQIASAHWYG